jgi:mannose-1-phosphate guanylyltransferase
MLVFESDRPSECGIIETDESGRVTAFHEKVSNPPSRTASAAVFVFSPEVGGLMPNLEPITPDISRDLIPLLLGKINVHQSTGLVIDIGTPQGLRAARDEGIL